MNVFTASGNVGKDAELRFTPAGKAIAGFSLAVKSGYGEHEKTSWLQCKLFGKQAEAISQYITKGSKVTVTGEFVEDKWTDQSGTERSFNTILVRDIDLPPKSSAHQVTNQPQHQQVIQQRPATQQQPVNQMQRPAPQQQYQPPQGYQNQPSDDWGDSIPF